VTTTQQIRPGRMPEADSTFSLAAESIVRPLAASALVRAEVGRILERVDAAQLGRRLVQDSLNEAAACTWWRRAEVLEWARPRPGDFRGNATPAELAARDRRLAAQAQACRNKAELLARHLLDDFEGASDDVH
jgi:hypothetical protein